MWICVNYSRWTVNRYAFRLAKIFNTQPIEMSSKNNDHSEKRKGSANNASKATVTEISDLSKTVKRLTLRVHSPSLHFLPGQWVDFFAPGVDIFTGYSMCSSPQLLKSNKLLQLAVKLSDYPPTTWVHTKCQPGCEVDVSVGGTFFYDHDTMAHSHLLLVAGGVGINPMMSILSSISDHLNDDDNATTKVILLYSASDDSELIFKEDILGITIQHPSIQVQYFITRQPSSSHINRRLGREDVEEAVKSLSPLNLQTFICGPSPMIDDVETWLSEARVKHIHYEKWW